MRITSEAGGNPIRGQCACFKNIVVSEKKTSQQEKFSLEYPKEP